MATPTLAAEAVIFAIHSAIKLSRNVQRAYAQSLQGRLMVIPLPIFDRDIDLAAIISFFEWAPELSAQLEDLERLHKRALEELQLPEEELRRYQQYYLSFKEVKEGKVQELQAADLAHLFRVRQWEEGYLERDSALKLVMGSLVEIGIDYFSQVPGALKPDTAKGRILRHFLSAFDEIRFVDGSPLQEQFNRMLLPRLFAAAAESVAELGGRISDDAKVQQFVRSATRQLAADLYERSNGLRYGEQQELADWGQLMLRSLVRHSGEFVAANPQAIFNTNYPLSLLIERSTGVLFAALLQEGSGGLQFRQALSADTLDRLIRASLEVAAQHPRLVSRQQGVAEIAAGLANAVQQSVFLEAGFLPELMRMVLEQSAGKLHLLWPAEQGSAEHLLVQALRQMLQELAESGDGTGWHPAFTQAQLLVLIEDLLEEVVYNPTWITESVRERPLLSELLAVVFRALRHLPKEERLQAETVQQLIRLSLQAVLAQQAVLDDLPWGRDEQKAIILEQALQLVFSFVFHPRSPRLDRAERLENLLAYALEIIMVEHPDRKGLVLLQLVLFESGMDYAQGFRRELAGELVDAALQALANHPELAARPEGLQALVKSLARTLDATQLRQPGLLFFLLRLLLEKTGQQAHLLLDAESGQPRHLLVTASREILAALAAQNGREGQWRPALTAAQAMQLLELLMDEVVRHPHWVSQGTASQSLLREVLDTVFGVLESLPLGQRLSANALEAVVQASLYAVARSPRLLSLTAAGGAELGSALEQALRLIFSFLFPTDSATPNNRLEMLGALLDYGLEGVMQQYPDRKGLILLDLVLFGQHGIDFSNGFDEDQADELLHAALRVLEQHPRLIVKGQVLRLMVTDIAGALADSGIDRPELLPELLRLTLDSSAEHLHLVVDLDQEEPINLLAIAAAQVLRALAEPPSEGQWKPRLSQAQIRSVLSLIYDEVLQHPRWIERSPLLYLLLQAIFQALEQVPARYPLTFSVFEMLLRAALHAARRQRRFLLRLEQADGSSDYLLLSLSLQDFFILIYQENGDAATLWHLTQGPVITALLDYYLMWIASSPAQSEDLQKAKVHLREVVQAWKEDFSLTLWEVIDRL